MGQKFNANQQQTIKRNPTPNIDNHTYMIDSIIKQEQEKTKNVWYRKKNYGESTKMMFQAKMVLFPCAFEIKS